MVLVLMDGLVRGGLRRPFRLRLGRPMHLLRLHCSWLVRLVLAAAAAAPMPAWLHLTVVRSGPLLWRGLH
jgi:hypothetical protein